MEVLAILIIVVFVVVIITLGVGMDVQGLERAILYRLMKEQK